MELDSTRRVHRWTDRARLILVLLNRFYENSLLELTPLFNHLNNLRNSDPATEALNPDTLRRQFNDIRAGKSGHQIYKAVSIDISLTEARRRYRDMREEIEDAAIHLAIVLRLRSCDGPQTPKHKIENSGPTRSFQKRTARRRQQRALSGDFTPDDTSSEDQTSNEPNSESESGSELELEVERDNETKKSPATTPRKPSSPVTPRRKRRRSQSEYLPEPFLTPPSSNTKSARKAQRSKSRAVYNKSPHLLFRWHWHGSQGVNTPTGFRAGCFSSSPSSPIPSSTWTPKDVRSHLVPEKVLSPYISFRDDMRSGLRRALQVNKKWSAYLTVVDFEVLKKIVGDEGLKPVPELVKRDGLELKMKRAKGCYTGNGEWLIYGEVPQAAIVATFSMATLKTHLDSIPRLSKLIQVPKLTGTGNSRNLWAMFKDASNIGNLNYRSGRAIRQWTEAIGIHEPACSYFAESFAKAWSLRPREGQSKADAFGAYMAGVQGEQQAGIGDVESESSPEPERETGHMVIRKKQPTKVFPQKKRVLPKPASCLTNKQRLVLANHGNHGRRPTPPPRSMFWNLNRFIYVPDSTPPPAQPQAPFTFSARFMEELLDSAQRASTVGSFGRAGSCETGTSEALRILNGKHRELAIMPKVVQKKKSSNAVVDQQKRTKVRNGDAGEDADGNEWMVIDSSPQEHHNDDDDDDDDAYAFVQNLNKSGVSKIMNRGPDGQGKARDRVETSKGKDNAATTAAAVVDDDGDIAMGPTTRVQLPTQKIQGQEVLIRMIPKYGSRLEGRTRVINRAKEKQRQRARARRVHPSRFVKW